MKYFYLLLLSVAFGCSEGSINERNVSTDGLGGLLNAEYSNGFVYTESSLDERVTEESESKSATRDPKILKSARLVFEAKDMDASYQQIMEATNKYKGFVENDNAGKSYNRVFRTLILRVPSESFQEYIEAVSEGVGYFDTKEIARRDVTEEFVDLEARLKAKKELEKRYLELLSQARNVKEMLEIERELSTIREEIEAKQGRLNYLENKVSLSTVSIEFYTLTSETGVTTSYGQKMKNALGGGWDGISVFFLGLLALWPLWLFLGLLIFVIRRYLKRRKRKKLNA